MLVWLRDHLPRYLCHEKFCYQLRARDTSVKLFWEILSSCVVSQQGLQKNFIFQSTVPQSHLLRYFCKEKLWFFAYHTEMILSCLSSSLVLWDKKSVAPGNIGSNMGQDPNSIVTIYHSLTHFNDMCGFTSYMRL